MLLQGIRMMKRLREKAETNMMYLFLKRVVNFLLNLTGTGDSLKVFYVKP